MSIKDFYYKIANLFGSNRYYFDKHATVMEYLETVPAEERPYAASFEELYRIALKYVEKQNYKKYFENQPNYFHELSDDEMFIAVFLGCVAFGISREIDEHGTEFETAIDKMLPNKYDINNPFDLKQGYGHRVFGHDPLAFGFKNLPADLLIKVTNIETAKQEIITIADFLNISPNAKVSMWDLIWKFYGSDSKLKGIMNCLGHIIVHFGKDICTPAGLPLPLISLFTEYNKSEKYGSYIQYKGSLQQRLDSVGINIKASDFAALLFIETINATYCRLKGAAIDYHGFCNEMKLISIGTCLTLQISLMLCASDLHKKTLSKKIIPGAKINLLLASEFFRLAIHEINSITVTRSAINNFYTIDQGGHSE